VAMKPGKPGTDGAASEFPAKGAGNSWQSRQSPGRTLKLLGGFAQSQSDFLVAPVAVDGQFQHVAAVLLIHQALQRLLILNRLAVAGGQQVAAYTEAEIADNDDPRRPA